MLYEQYGYLIHDNNVWAALKAHLPLHQDGKKVEALVKKIYERLSSEQPASPPQQPAQESPVRKPKQYVTEDDLLKSEISRMETEWKQLFKQFSLLHEHGFNLPDEETAETRELVKQKMNLWYQITALQDDIDYIEANGELPVKKSKAVKVTAQIPDSPAEQMKLFKNIPSLLSQVRSRLAANEQAFKEEKDRKNLQQLSQKINKQKARIEELESQRLQLKKILA